MGVVCVNFCVFFVIICFMFSICVLKLFSRMEKICCWLILLLDFMLILFSGMVVVVYRVVCFWWLIKEIRILEMKLISDVYIVDCIVEENKGEGE